MAISLTARQIRTIGNIYGDLLDYSVLIARAGKDVPARAGDSTAPNYVRTPGATAETVYVTSDVLQIRVHPDGEHEVVQYAGRPV